MMALYDSELSPYSEGRLCQGLSLMLASKVRCPCTDVVEERPPPRSVHTSRPKHIKKKKCEGLPHRTEILITYYIYKTTTNKINNDIRKELIYNAQK